MYEKIDFSKELKQLPQKEVIRFLASQLKKNESLQKEFIKRFNLSIQKKFIQDYEKEFETALKKCTKSLGNKKFKYDYLKFNSSFLNEKISYTKILEKQKEYLEALKIYGVIYCYLCKIISNNGHHEIGKPTTAEKYETRWKNVQEKICELYLKINEEDRLMFDKKRFFNLLKDEYEPMLHSYVFNFIFVRKHMKLEWLKEILKDEDKKFLEDFNK